MTRKDYVAIAAAIKEARLAAGVVQISNPPKGRAVDGVDRAANAVAWVLGHDNPRFDRERFLKACGVAS